MSLKLYNGFFVKGNPDIRTLDSYFRDLRTKIQEAGNKEFRNLLINRYGLVLDVYEIDEERGIALYREIVNADMFQKDTAKIYYYLELLKKVEQANFENRRSAFDLSCKLHIIPIQDKIVGLYFFENLAYTKIITNCDWFEDYHYQNQTDRPEAISEIEWEQRRKDWAEALGENYIPNDQGFTVELFNTDKIPFDICKNLKPIYDKRKRAKYVAENIYQYDKFDGTNYSVFLSKEYSDFIEEKINLIIPKLKDNPFEK